MSKQSEYVRAARRNLRELDEWVDQNFPEGYIVAPVLEHFAKRGGLPMDAFGDEFIDKEKLLGHGWSGAERRSLSLACDLFEAAKVSGGGFDETYTSLVADVLARLSWRLLVGERPVHALQPGTTPPWTGQTNWNDYVAEQLGASLGRYLQSDQAYQEETVRKAREEREREHRATTEARLERYDPEHKPAEWHVRVGDYGRMFTVADLDTAKRVAEENIAAAGFHTWSDWVPATNDWGVPTTEATIAVTWAEVDQAIAAQDREAERVERMDLSDHEYDVQNSSIGGAPGEEDYDPRDYDD